MDIRNLCDHPSTIYYVKRMQIQLIIKLIVLKTNFIRFYFEKLEEKQSLTQFNNIECQLSICILKNLCFERLNLRPNRLDLVSVHRFFLCQIEFSVAKQEEQQF